MQHDSLDWSIEPIEYESSSFDKNGNEVPFQALYAKVLPIINGVPLDTAWVYDTLGVLARTEVGRYTMDMLTCSCGHAGCAGIDDPVHIRVGMETVQWQFPRQDPFPKALVPNHFASVDEPFLWTFDAKQYHASIAGLVARLDALEKSTELPFYLSPDDGIPHEAVKQTMATTLAKSKQWVRQRQDNTRDEQAYWGVLYLADLAIPVEHAVLTMSVRTTLDAVADHLFGDIDDEDTELQEKHDAWCKDQSAYYRQHPEEVVALFKSLPWASVQEHSYLLDPQSERLYAYLASQWPNVPAKLVPYESDESKDWRLI